MPKHEQIIEITDALDAAAPLLWAFATGKSADRWKTLPEDIQQNHKDEVETILIAAYPYLVAPFLRHQIVETATGLLIAMADHLQEQQRDTFTERELGFANGVTAVLEHLTELADSIHEVKRAEQTP